MWGCVLLRIGVPMSKGSYSGHNSVAWSQVREVVQVVGTTCGWIQWVLGFRVGVSISGRQL